jgi:AcrR family transcriptional regulator
MTQPAHPVPPPDPAATDGPAAAAKPARGRGRPRAEPREAQRMRLIDAARRAFTTRGFDEVTLSAIAADADVPRTVVYDVVGTKDDLLAAVAEQAADDLVGLVDERFEQRAEDIEGPLDEIVRADVGWFVELMVREPAYARIIALSGRLSQRPEDPVRRARQRIEDRLCELHEARATALGLQRPATARALSVVLLALLERVALRAVEQGWSTAELADLVGDFATGGYLHSEATGAAERFEQATDP